MTRPSAVALHEAGHCVVSAHYSDRGVSVSIEAHGDVTGTFVCTSLPVECYFGRPEERAEGLRRMRVAVAGALAQVRGTRESWWPWVSGTDLVMLREGYALVKGAPELLDDPDLLDFELGFETGASKPVAYGDVWALAVDPMRGIFRRRGVWPAVLRLAAALDRERTIEIRDRYELLDGLPWCWAYPGDDVTVGTLAASPPQRSRARAA